MRILIFVGIFIIGILGSDTNKETPTLEGIINSFVSMLASNILGSGQNKCKMLHKPILSKEPVNGNFNIFGVAVRVSDWLKFCLIGENLLSAKSSQSHVKSYSPVDDNTAWVEIEYNGTSYRDEEFSTQMLGRFQVNSDKRISAVSMWGDWGGFHAEGMIKTRQKS